MNGKFIILFFVCANLLSVWFALQADQTPQSNILSDLFTFDSSIEQNAQPSITSEFNESIGGLLTPTSSGVSSDLGGFSFFDGIGLAFGIITLFTPFPLFAFFYTLGLPFMITLFLAIPILILYIISMAEFIRGNQL